jgi:hypothetical protein
LDTSPVNVKERRLSTAYVLGGKKAMRIESDCKKYNLKYIKALMLKYFNRSRQIQKKFAKLFQRIYKIKLFSFKGPMTKV